MITIFEKDDAVIITIENPIPMEENLIKQARRTQQMAMWATKKKDIESQVKDKPASAWGRPKKEDLSEKWHKVEVYNPDGTLFVEADSLDKEEMDYYASFYEGDGYKVKRSVNDKRTTDYDGGFAF